VFHTNTDAVLTVVVRVPAGVNDKPVQARLLEDRGDLVDENSLACRPDIDDDRAVATTAPFRTMSILHLSRFRCSTARTAHDAGVRLYLLSYSRSSRVRSTVGSTAPPVNSVNRS
jgi:hypothetical protein